MKHNNCNHPSTPAARRACRMTNPTVKPVPETSTDDLLDALVDIDQNTSTGYLNGPPRDPDQPSWLSSEGVIHNGGIKPPGQENMSSPTGSNKRVTKQRKEAMHHTRPTTEGFFQYEDQVYRVVSNKDKTALYARIISPDNTYGEYVPGIIKSLKESMRIPTPDFLVEVPGLPGVIVERPSAPVITQPGFYELDGNIYKVKQGRSGRLYALHVTQGDTKGTFASGVVFRLTEDMKLTEERASAFGRITGQCLICGRTLTDPSSIDRGIGPVCASRMGW